MDERPTWSPGQRLARGEASAAVNDLGWRYLLGTLSTAVPVASLTEAVQVASGAVAACGEHADRHLRVDVRPERVVLTLQSSDAGTVTGRDVDLAFAVSDALARLGRRAEPGSGPAPARSVQRLEIAIDALDIVAVRPFWRAVLAYTDEVGATGPEAAIVDPLGQGPAVWFQQMTEPRRQRNRLHVDISVPHDEAARRIAAALEAGGRVVSARAAPAFWVLADAEGNEACITTWQGRD